MARVQKWEGARAVACGVYIWEGPPRALNIIIQKKGYLILEKVYESIEKNPLLLIKQTQFPLMMQLKAINDL